LAAQAGWRFSVGLGYTILSCASRYIAAIASLVLLFGLVAYAGALLLLAQLLAELLGSLVVLING
jgi:hypothetical protein